MVITMATYTARPGDGHRSQKAWDVLAARYPEMQPTILVSQLQDALGWQWSMQFKSRDGNTVFWDSVSVAEIRDLVALKSKAKQPVETSGLWIVKSNPNVKK
jgi:hypothetical protein